MSTGLATTGASGLAMVTDTMDALKAIRTFIKEEFVQGVDFGKIPGTGTKDVLLLPGAQKAEMYFNCAPHYTIERCELGDGHVEYIITTSLIHRVTGTTIGEGVGSCSTMEGKYRYRKAERRCPACGATAIITGKREYGGGFLCYRNKGGCGAKFGDHDTAIVDQEAGQVENANIWDIRNTVLKMAKKRSSVDAAMSLACLSELFTQDVEDTYDISATVTAAVVPDRPRLAPPEDRRDQAKAEVNRDFGGQPQDAPHAGNVPRTGKALYAWAREMGDRHSIELIKYLNGWAKLQELPARMVDWTEDQAAMGYAEAVRKMRQLAPGGSVEPAPQAPKKPDFTNGTTHGDGKYAAPNVVQAFREWVTTFATEANAAWADHWMDAATGELPAGINDLTNQWHLTNHLCGWAREKGLVNTPEGFSTAQADKLVAIVFEKDPGALRDEANRKCSELWSKAAQAHDLSLAEDVADVPVSREVAEAAIAAARRHREPGEEG